MKASQKAQKNNNLQNTKYEMSTRGVPVLTFSLPGVWLTLLPPCQLRHWASLPVGHQKWHRGSSEM